MNLVAVTELINHPDVDLAMRKYYMQRRDELVDRLNEQLKHELGQKPRSLRWFLTMSDKPELVKTLGKELDI